MKRLALTGNECMNCLACEIVCANTYYKSDDLSLSCIQVREKKNDVAPAFCVQCGKCAKSCESEAITQNKKGVYKIDKEKCIECGKCVEACPFSVMIWQEGSKPTKCISCNLCVKVCPMDVLYMKED